MPEAIPAVPRRDDTAADARSLERMGRIDPQPVPAAPPDQPPVPPSAPDLVDQQEAATLSAALVDAGVAASSEDQDAVRALARLDPDTVAAVTRWLKTKKTPDRGDIRG